MNILGYTGGCTISMKGRQLTVATAWLLPFILHTHILEAVKSAVVALQMTHLGGHSCSVLARRRCRPRRPLPRTKSVHLRLCPSRVSISTKDHRLPKKNPANRCDHRRKPFRESLNPQETQVVRSGTTLVAHTRCRNKHIRSIVVYLGKLIW